MRYYEIRLPGSDSEPILTKNVRQYRDLPEGTFVQWVITDRDGTPIDFQKLDVKNGRVQFLRENVRTPKLR